MIPVFNIKRQNKEIGEKLKKEIEKVVEGGLYILGPNVGEFEKGFARYLGVKYAVGVASGTDALSLALLACGVNPDDEVILPANSYPSSFAITAIGAIPKLVDIEKDTFNIRPSQISRVITKKAKAIMPVHLYGQPADMDKIMVIARKYNLKVVEDCAQAHGAMVKVMNKELRIENYGRGNEKSNQSALENWKKVGTIGDVGCFSFYPTKNLGAFGDGGMVVTNNPDIYEKLKLLRMYGEKGRYNSILVGRNSRLDELQAAILLVKLKYLDKWDERRREIARLYFSLFEEEAVKAKVVLPYGASNVWHVYHLFVIRIKKRSELKKYLEKYGIQTAIHYPVPIHLSPSMRFLGYMEGDFPESESAAEEVLSLPMFPELADEEVKKVAQAVIKFYEKS
ncbi:DegT/DnrJ/EryC1/StrS family aminotransferase [Patescibacteria group bacterium]|nr:DegT/DnrJ/EryC1/StrS family aminotransferase [Patescibacteria group bacterium]